MFAASVHFDGDRATVAVAQCRLVGFGEPLLHVGVHAQTVDDDFDRVFRVLGELGHRIDLADLAVDAHADEALGAELHEELELLALAIDDDRREDHELRILICVTPKGERRVDHLRDRHRGEALLGMVGTIGIANARVQEPQVIMDLGDRAYRRARVVRRRLLLDRDRRRQTFDQVDVRLFHELQELPGVRRQRLDVTPLPFGIQRVEGE
jgi:hypothetical protein